MAQKLQRFGVPLGQDGDRGVRLERPVEVPDGPVHPGGERGASEARPDPRGELAGRRAPRHLAHAAVGERDPDRVAHRPSDADGGAGGSLDGAKAK